MNFNYDTNNLEFKKNKIKNSMKMEFHSWLVRAHPTTETLSSIYYFSSKMIH